MGSAVEPVRHKYKIKTTQLNDETGLLQLGEAEPVTLYGSDGFEAEPAFADKFPSDENPDAIWTYVNFNISLDNSLRQVSRKTYSLLDWCGDWGGLLDALFLIAELLVYPVSIN